MDIETEFKKMQRWYEASRKKKNATGREAVLRFLLEHPEKIWWWSWEFIGNVTSKGDFLSHRAPARASDLALMEPMLVEHRKVGRFACYRLRREHSGLIETRLAMHEEITMPVPPKVTYPVSYLVDGMRRTLITNSEEERDKALAELPGAML